MSGKLSYGSNSVKNVYMYYKYIAMPSPHSARVRMADLGGTITLHPVTP